MTTFIGLDGCDLIKLIPTKVLGLAQEPVLEPGYDWEQKVQVPDAVFVEEFAREGSRCLLY
jgi:predicted GH43/DUF377 family glycosyl hydrolase